MILAQAIEHFQLTARVHCWPRAAVMRVWVTVRAGRFRPKHGDYLESNSICELGDDDLSVPTQLGLGIGRTETSFHLLE